MYVSYSDMCKEREKLKKVITYWSPRPFIYELHFIIISTQVYIMVFKGSYTVSDVVVVYIYNN